MARVIFYGKPSCGGNARQRALLRASGHEVEERDLFRHPWTAPALRAFFGDLPPQAWFNRSAVKVKSGEVKPEGFAEEEALAALLADPPLIRRPLMEIDGRLFTGWDADMLGALVGLTPGGRPVTEACVRPEGTGCSAPAEASQEPTTPCRTS